MKSTWISNQILALEPEGYITAANASGLEQELTAAVMTQEYSVFLLDMDKVEFLDSSGLVALVSTFRLTESLGKRFSICSTSPSVRIVFELTGLDKIFEIFDDRAAFELALSNPVAA